MRVTMTHDNLPGVERVVTLEAYRFVWWAEGWRSADDPGWSGPPGAVPPPSLAGRVGFTPALRRAAPAAWPEVVFSVHAASPSTSLSFEHGQAVARGSGSGTGARSDRRSVFMIPGSPGGYSRIRSRWSGLGTTGPLVPQRGHMHGVGIQADGMRRGAIVWHDIVFSSPQVFNLAVWQTSADGSSGFAVRNGALVDSVAVSAGVRASNVVTLTVPSGHGFGAGDVIQVDVADNTYDGVFTITSVTATTVVYGQTAADDASSGTGTVTLARNSLTKSGLVRSVAVSDAVRSSGVVTATVAAGHSFQIGDPIIVDLTDATYDGQAVVTATTATTVAWRQAAADDASSGSGTISRVFPYWVESEWTAGLIRMRAWPDVSSAGGVTGAMPAGPPPWESPWATAVDLTGLGDDQPDPAYGKGCGIVAAHLASGSTVTEVRYDNVEVAAL